MMTYSVYNRLCSGGGGFRIETSLVAINSIILQSNDKLSLWRLISFEFKMKYDYLSIRACFDFECALKTPHKVRQS